MHIAIIAEYNPFHSGHKYQIDELRRIFGEDTVISVILGGIFSQRGEPYSAPPYIRAEAAVKCGADLVLELPFPFSCAPASVFARAGVEIAEKIGADILAFGSECGDLEKLKETLAKLDSSEIQTALEETNDASLGKTRAFSNAFKKLYGDGTRTDTPNDILAFEYLRAIDSLGAKIKPYTIHRRGDYKSGEGEYPSASSLRRTYASGGITAIKRGMPEKAYEIFKKAEGEGLLFPNFDRLSSAAILKLSCDTAEDTAFTGGGICGRLKSAAKDAKSISELLSLAATKRYTNAELSRALLFSLFSVKRSDLDAPIRYTKLLGANTRGRKIINGDTKIEIITKPSDTAKLSDAARTQYEKTGAAEQGYALCLDGRYEYLKQSPRIEK